MKLIFCMQISSLYNLLQIDIVILMEMVKHSESSQNSEVRDEIDFLHADKHQSFLQVELKSTLGIKVS